MKVVERTSSSGGLIREFFNEDGQRVKVLHSQGNKAKDEEAEVPTKRPYNKRAVVE